MKAWQLVLALCLGVSALPASAQVDSKLDLSIGLGAYGVDPDLVITELERQCAQ